MFLKKKEKAGTDEIKTYIEWRAYVKQKYKKYSKKELIDFAKFLEWRAEEIYELEKDSEFWPHDKKYIILESKPKSKNQIINTNKR